MSTIKFAFRRGHRGHRYSTILVDQEAYMKELLTASDFVGKISGKRQRHGMYIALVRKSSQAPRGATLSVDLPPRWG
jgi:hypothetical protein